MIRRWLAALLILSFTSSLGLTCPCVHFNSTGRFHSPNYPQPFRKTPCLLYHFVAPPGHSVNIVFTTLSLPSSTPSDPCRSFIGVYDSSMDGEIDLSQDPQVRLCGGGGLEASPFPSLYQHLLLYVSTHRESRGFIGQYSFHSQDAFVSTGRMVGPCSFVAEPNKDTLKGTLYSPRYPYYIQPHSNCSYHFESIPSHRLTIRSSLLTLSNNSLLYAVDNTGAVLSRWEGGTSFLVSSPHSLTLYLIAGDSSNKRGVFQMEYEYTGSEDSRMEDREEEEQKRLDKQSLGEVCTVELSSSSAKEGVFSSSSLSAKGQSGQPLRCIVTFKGEPKEKVSVKFTSFDLAPSLNHSAPCRESDHLLAFVLVHSHLSSVSRDGWCTQDMPPQLMAPTALLQLQYTTKQNLRVPSASHGFAVRYKFHEDWEMDSMAALSDTSKNCRFIFNSARNKSGVLWSVNYPGLYPRNTLCEYIFIGTTNDEIVHIYFDYFDVEGFDQCGEGSESDYVLFSNYQTHDRTNRRFCGRTPPRSPVVSESNYFRLIFSSNELFDGTGFYARYQFLTPARPSLSRVKQLPSYANSLCQYCSLLFIALSLLLSREQE